MLLNVIENAVALSVLFNADNSNLRTSSLRKVPSENQHYNFMRLFSVVNVIVFFYIMIKNNYCFHCFDCPRYIK